MTAYTFVPTTTAPFQFQPTLDGTVYTAIITWSLFGRRFYLNLFQLDGTLVACVAVVGSPLNYDINLIAGYFTTSTLVYRQPSNQFEVGP